MSQKIKMAKPEHTVLYQDLCALVNKHADKIAPIEILAIAANMVGQLIALQDQRTVSPELAMETVAANIEQGNQEVMAQLGYTIGSA